MQTKDDKHEQFAWTATSRQVFPSLKDFTLEAPTQYILNATERNVQNGAYSPVRHTDTAQD